jgi:hypothetical protein
VTARVTAAAAAARLVLFALEWFLLVLSVFAFASLATPETTRHAVDHGTCLKLSTAATPENTRTQRWHPSRCRRMAQSPTSDRAHNPTPAQTALLLQKQPLLLAGKQPNRTNYKHRNSFNIFSRLASSDCRILFETCSKLHATIHVQPESPFEVRLPRPQPPDPPQLTRVSQSTNRQQSTYTE